MANEPIITITGNLTADPELKILNSGISVCNFTVAQTPRTKDNTGNWTDGEPAYFRCAAWREYGENIAQTFKKGMRVIVQGRFSVETYQSNDGQRTRLDIQVDEAGPVLKYATAIVQKTQRNNTGTGWNNTQPQQSFNDAPPF